MTRRRSRPTRSPLAGLLWLLMACIGMATGFDVASGTAHVAGGPLHAFATVAVEKSGLVRGSGRAGPAQGWPSFRGPNAGGLADGTRPPLEFDAERGVNLAWKTPIPGLAHSSPVVWGDRVFVSTAVSADPDPVVVSGHTQTADSAGDLAEVEWRVYALRLRSGEVLWQRTVRRGVPAVDRHVKGTHANSTPATDGEHLVVLFGSQGLFALALDGAPLWERELGVLEGGWAGAPGLQWGFGSSPILWNTLVIVQCDTQRESFLAAFDVRDGREVWRVGRDEDTSWSTPALWTDGERVDLVVSGTRHFRGYDPRSGRERWRLADGADVKIPTPVVADGRVYLGGGSTHMQSAFWALVPGAGDLTPVAGTSIGDDRSAGAGAGQSAPREDETAGVASRGDQGGGATVAGGIVWRNRARPHVVTPIVYRGYLYVCSDNGVLTLYDAATGERLDRMRLGRGAPFAASPVAADGHLYFASEDGDVYVLPAGPELDVMAVNRIGEVVLATPALADGMILVRGRSHLFAFVRARP